MKRKKETKEKRKKESEKRRKKLKREEKKKEKKQYKLQNEERLKKKKKKAENLKINATSNFHRIFSIYVYSFFFFFSQSTYFSCRHPSPIFGGGFITQTSSSPLHRLMGEFQPQLMKRNSMAFFSPAVLYMPVMLAGDHKVRRVLIPT